MSAILSKSCRKCSLALIFMLILQFASSQDFSNLQTMIKNNGKNLGKEYTIVVQKGGKNIFLAETDELKFKTPNQIGYASAWLSAALVMTFVDQNKLSLDDPISKYIPELKKHMKGYITVKHCLTQTTGLDVDASGVMKVAQKNKFQNLDEEVDFFATKKLIVDNPGEAFSYSSVGLNMLGKVLEIISKKSFDRLAAERLFRPLSMRTATFYNEEGNAPNPTTGASCSAYDYINFMQMLANKGMFNGKRILSENAVNTLLDVHFPEARIRFTPDNTREYQYAMGCWLEEADEKNNGMIYSSFGPLGSAAWFDLKKKYFGTVIIGDAQNYQKTAMIDQIRKIIDESID